jgi:hypothetical protein
MTKRELLQWGKSMSYPFLVLPNGLRLHHGRPSYEQANRMVVSLASLRIAQWNAMVEETRKVS